MRYDAEKNATYLNTWDMLKHIFIHNRQKVVKESVSSSLPLPAPAGVKVNYVAIVLDGEIREVIRAEDGLTALLLSSPEFVSLEDSEDRPTIGWKFDNGKFVKPEHVHGHGHEH